MYYLFDNKLINYKLNNLSINLINKVRTYYSDSPSIKSKGRRFKSINNLIMKIKYNEYINKKNLLSCIISTQNLKMYEDSVSISILIVFNTFVDTYARAFQRISITDPSNFVKIEQHASDNQ